MGTSKMVLNKTPQKTILLEFLILIRDIEIQIKIKKITGILVTKLKGKEEN
jgi:hypothetical protein